MYAGDQMVPPGCVWLEGDNMHNSTDSRSYGPVPIALLQGRVVMQIWHKIRKIDSTSWIRRDKEMEAEDLKWGKRRETSQEAEQRKLQREQALAAIEELLARRAEEDAAAASDEHEHAESFPEEIV